MEKLNRLGWVAGFSFTAYGVRFGIRVNNAAVLDRLFEHLPFGWKPSASPVVERLYSLIVGGSSAGSHSRRFHLLYGNLERLARTFELAEVFDRLAADLRLYVAEAARRRIFVHAGAAGWQGRAILIPGRSFSGKTTLVAELVKAGASYYSDEYAVLDQRGRLHPFHKPLALREGNTSKQRGLNVESLGGQTGVKPLPVGLVVVSWYRPGAKWRPRRLSAGQGMLQLLANTVSARRQVERTLLTLQQVTTHAPVLKGARGEAREIVDSIFELLEKEKS